MPGLPFREETMQIPLLPPLPVAPGALPPEALARAVPQIQAQAAAPIIQRAVDPSGHSERGNKSRSNEERSKGGGKSGRGGSVNIRV